MAHAKLISREQNIARVAVEFDQAEVEQHYAHMYRENAKDMRLAGFRQGKIPRNILRQRLGAEAITAHMSALLKDAAVEDACEQLSLQPRAGKLEWHSAPQPEEGSALAYDVSIPVLPEVTLPDFSQWEINVPLPQVTDEMVQRYKQRLRERFTNMPAKEGASEAGNALEVSFTSQYADGGEAPFQYQGMVHKLGEEGNLPGWDDLLTGRSAGDRFEFDYTLPDNFADARLAGRELKIALTVDSVHTLEVPELDETFIRERLQMDNPEQFDSFVTSTLERETVLQHEQLKRELALARCVQELQADITPDMVDSETDALVEENDRLAHANGTTLQQYLDQKGQSLGDYRASLREAALRRLRLFLTVQTVASQQQFSVSSDDMRRYAIGLMHKKEGISPEQVGELLRNRAFLQDATFDILRDKAVGYIVQQAQFVVENAPADAGETATE